MAETGPLLLVVDDDFDVRESICDLLRDEGYQVEPALNGAIALEKLRGGLKPKLILLDLMMPVMGGAEFCEHWQADPELSKIPVLVMSAAGNASRSNAVAKATAFLPKPLDLTVLFDRVKALAH
jgi:CheY-like chemotaxis protein